MNDLGVNFSEGEIALAVSGVSDNFRIDGRSCFDLREIDVRTGVLNSCNGSSQVQSKNLNIIVGVKAEVGRPSTDEPDSGIVEINADFSAAATPKFQAHEILFILRNSLIPSIDRKSLCISVGHKVWIIYIDVMILECGSIAQTIDMSAIGIKAALRDTLVPRLIADEEDANEFVLSADSEYCPVTTDLPNLVTLTRINDQYVADVNEEEEAAGVARLTLGVDSKGHLLYYKKSGAGSLHPDPLKEVLTKAGSLAEKLNSQIKY